MKIPFRLLTLTYIIGFTFNTNLSFAQIKFGPQAGLNFSELPNNTEYIIGNHHIYTGYHVGVIAEIRLVKELFLRPGVLITNKGSKYTVGNNIGDSANGFSNFRFSGFYTDIPINLAYKFDLRSFKFLLIAGAQLGYGLTGTWQTSDGTTSKVHFGNDPVDDFKPFDYGLDFGAGVEFGRIQITSVYYMGLKTLSTLSPPLTEQKFKVLSISVAYLFGKEKRAYKNSRSESCRTYDDYKPHRKKHY
jgi:hypothetical protein